MSNDPTPLEIKALAEDYGYVERRQEASCTLFFKEKGNQRFPALLNIFYTTRGVMTQLSHPTKGYNALWRSDAYDSLETLAELFENPRTHTGKGYRQAKDAVRGCARCGFQKKRACFSDTQWKLGQGKTVCFDCIGGSSFRNVATTNGQSAENPIINLRHAMRLDSKKTMERRQFNCPKCPQEGRGKHVFFKKVPANKPVVKCPKCKNVNQGDCDRLYPIPKGEEKGYGFFRCHACNSTWASSRSISNIGQQCHVCKVSGKSNNYVKPFRIEVPRPEKGKGIAGGGAGRAGRGMKRVPKESIPENEPENANYSAADGQRFNSNGNNGLAGDRGTGVGRSFDFVPVNEDEASSQLHSKTRSVHKCEGCASGICRSRKLPISGVHDSSGDTVFTSGSVMTNSRIDDSEFLDMDAGFDDWKDDGSF